MKKTIDWIRDGSAEKEPLRSRIMLGSGSSALAKIMAVFAVLTAEQDALERIADSIGGEPWMLAVGFGVALGGDLLAMWARIDDHVKGRTK